ncbi:nucleotidyltransferase domain-containing protein [Nonomuraea sp. ATR24]|uniref:nucleotidyltransferase domain-containing protein n=1 Tax=Nonomuraea TaxID=83681 RepID=UPI001C5E5FC9|nr:hypothetical protein [Nonomuraea ceibae]
MFTLDDVLEVLALIEDAGCRTWIGGGWGVDALIGRPTRPHRDLDLLHRAEQEPALIDALTAAGFAEQPGAVPGRPVRFVMADARGRELDLHPLTFAADGSAVQPADAHGATFPYPAGAFTWGTLGGRRVRCLSAAQQVTFHQGYEPAERDVHDMRLLRETFGVDTPF